MVLILQKELYLKPKVLILQEELYLQPKVLILQEELYVQVLFQKPPLLFVIQEIFNICEIMLTNRHKITVLSWFCCYCYCYLKIYQFKVELFSFLFSKIIGLHLCSTDYIFEKLKPRISTIYEHVY